MQLWPDEYSVGVVRADAATHDVVGEGRSCRRSGAAVYFTKPFTWPDSWSALRTTLASR